ncbi:MAG: hypothetical protein HYR84_12565 [Planctomycetes bacterium]|nr:hypothetical protein [Planctomycetota bacterium]
MKIVSVSLGCLTALALFCQPGAVGEACDPPKDPVKVKIYCPVVGIPDSNRCACTGAAYYCSLVPKATLTAEYKGAKLQFCCGGCAKTFKENPSKFAVSSNHQLLARKLATQHKCPLCGGKHDSAAVVEVVGLKVYFCSQECVKKVTNAKPADRVNLVFGEQAFARGFVLASEPKK